MLNKFIKLYMMYYVLKIIMYEEDGGDWKELAEDNNNSIIASFI